MHITQSEVLADALTPIELEVGLNKIAHDINEIIDAVLLTLSLFLSILSQSRRLSMA